MELLSLPGEILHLILVQAALSRGLKRTLRLRLVCKTFDKAIYYPALFESRLLDNEHLRRRHCRGPVYTCNTHDHGVAKLWHNYLVHRAMSERDASVGRFVEIRQLAQTIVDEAQAQMSETEWDLRHVVDVLCWSALESGTKAPGGPYENWKREEATDLDKLQGFPTPMPRLSLLAAAAVFDMVPLATALLAEGHSPKHHNNLLPPAIQVAAQSGNIAMLKLFLTHPSYGSGFDPYAVYGAAVRGDMEIMKLVFPSPNGNDGANDSGYGSINWRSDASKAIPKARRATLSPEVYEYLSNAWAPGPRSGRTPWYADLVSHAGRGNAGMVTYLLDERGVPVDEKNSEELESALERACRCGQDEVVDLLLERGADPDFTGHALWGAVPIRMAASGGHASIVRKLIEHGARLEAHSDGGRDAEMVDLLLERGATIRAGVSLATTVSHLGYGSMLDIVRQHGFDADPATYGLPIRWIEWPENTRLKAGWFRRKREGEVM
ncbi:ankyrin repeat containing protein [Apiospora hydei]|uniref:Ankyrin repeat containing protein n=1 Tax=Apiospora hydei TaxID=1337664 RepID=A0ABR1VWZ7_9PEZI